MHIQFAFTCPSPKVDKANIDRLKLYEDISDDEKCETSEEELDDCGDTVDAKVTPEKVSCDKYSSKACSTLNGSWFNQHFTSNVPNDCDEGLGEIEVGDTASNNCQGINQAIHSDQSEDSSLTDSERTLVGDELSPRNNSPDIMGTEMEQDIEPSISDVTKPECDSLLMNSENGCGLMCQNKCRNLSSPEENTEDFQYCNHANCTPKPSLCANQPVKRYFRAWPYNDYETGERMLRVYVDKRITLGELKKELESHIGIKADNFKIFRVYSNNQEFECTKLSDNLMSYGDDSRLTIKLGRALRKNEYKVKIYQFAMNDSEPIKFLIDWVIVKGMAVLKLKKEILPHIKETSGLDVPLNRCRLRKKSWKNPGNIYFDHQRFDKDIPVNSNWEMFLEVLPDAEPVTSNKQLTLFTRLWHPAAYKLDPFKEIVIDDTRFETLLQQLHQISGIPEEFIEIAKGQGTFPVKDKKRRVKKKLSDVEKREITNKENARSNKNLRGYSSSPRKEKALKIYTLDSPSTTQASQSTQYRNSSTQSAQHVVPDLD
ncbi:ubiquitin carboxyl-terminal hydrolase 47 [Caerostris extrusa]|uniref:Ubiquitin carboxyl-terminal hydrolase 47 n=1 Tax=Caerostris extrusa TaxID=172846 RepID=A0AAV4NQY8_CAEEX|nr:ubiquitin carboxyl-terminal hydrolase 47 [Caerostris extrusa]